MKKLSKEKEKEILKLYLEDKLSTTQISKISKISSTCVSNIVKRNGIVPRNISESKKGVKKGTKLPVEEIIFLYTKQNKTSIEIATKLGVTKRSILMILNNNNINMRKSGWKEEYQNPLTPLINELYLNNLSMNEISKQINLSYSSINRILKKLNITRTENKNKGNLGKHQSLETKGKVSNTKINRKKQGLYDHIYLKKTGYTYKEFMEKLPEFKKYFQKVRTITNKQPLETLENFNKRGVCGIDGAYNLDHCYSIIEGFKNNVPAEIIGNIKNLKMIPWEENLTKQGNCSIELEELKKLIYSNNIRN